eukprot:6085863-Amphidinium_carterae.1
MNSQATPWTTMLVLVQYFVTFHVLKWPFGSAIARVTKVVANFAHHVLLAPKSNNIKNHQSRDG